MRKDKVITFHRVKVKEDFAEDHPCYPWRGKEGQIQPPPLPYVLPGDYVSVKLDGHDNLFVFEAAHLDDLSRPLPEVGDIVSIKAKVISRQGERIWVAATHDPGGGGSNWLDRSDVQYVVERAKPAEAEKIEPEGKPTYRFRGTYTHHDRPAVSHRFVTLPGRDFTAASNHLTALAETHLSLSGYRLVSVTLT